MNHRETKIVLITGASSGIGKVCAEHLARKDCKVYGTSRECRLESNGFALIKMDVADDLSVKQGIDHLLEQERKIDVVINNAGIGIAGPIENTSIEYARKQFETNFFGTYRVCNAVLPQMRKQRAGLIINISSIAGLLGLPFQSLYSASKFAIEGMTEGLRMEVKRYGIRVTLLDPGDFKTNFTYNREKVEHYHPNSVYREQFDKTIAIIEKNELDGPNPQAIAKLVEKIIKTKSPRVRYTVGNFDQKLVPGLKRILPSKVFERIIMGYYKMIPS
jgi:short-subunit dehydrogenase